MNGAWNMERIKILFFIEEIRAGGAEKVLCDLVNSMDQNRFEITVQTLWKANAAQFLDPGIRYRSCYAGKTTVNKYRSRLEAAAGLTYPLHIKDDYDIEVAYLECGPTKILGSSTNKRAKKLAWVHCDLELKMSDPQAFAEKAARWYETYDRVVCVSQNVKESFDRLFGIPEKTLVLYNTVDDEAIRAKSEAKLPELPAKRRLTAVTLGRLTYQKAYDRLLRIHKHLIDEGLACDLWILGEGEDRPAMESFIAENNLSDSVRLFGYCDNPYPFIKCADLLVCSSRYEGFSTFVTEGLILGKAIVTTDCTGMRELLGNSEYGLIMDNSEDALLDGMRRMLTEDALRAQYAALAAKRGVDFSKRSLTSAAEALFDSLL
jgi:glycosyltransferase involved in cell wall biosynthesis